MFTHIKDVFPMLREDTMVSFFVSAWFHAPLARHSRYENPMSCCPPKTLLIWEKQCFASNVIACWFVHPSNSINWMIKMFCQNQCYSCRDHFVNAPCQWETTLHCNVVSHWPGAYTKWSLELSAKASKLHLSCFVSFGAEWCRVAPSHHLNQHPIRRGVAWINIDLPSVGSCGIHLKVLSHQILKISFYLKIGANVLNNKCIQREI